MGNASYSDAAKLPMLGNVAGDAAPSPDSSPPMEGPRRQPRQVREILEKERNFLLLIGAMFLLAGLAAPMPSIAMWMGFVFASYSVISNDSIQTIGTFISSNRDTPWWVLWLFVGVIFLLTVGWSWLKYDGDVSYQRLTATGFSTAPTSFTFLQVAAPIFLLILTRLRMPVSTTFLILSCFSTSSAGYMSMATKSVAGYGVAFAVSIVVWLVLSRWVSRKFTGTPHPLWRPAQWGATAFLWSMWLMQDAANVAVFLPRQLSTGQFISFAGIFFVGLGILFYLGGDRLQEVVDEKSNVEDVRSATLIGIVYGSILYFFKEVSNVPMSTTWVFIGLLAGREIAMAITRSSERSRRQAARLIGRDLGYVTVGLILSVFLAITINVTMREELFVMLGLIE